MSRSNVHLRRLVSLYRRNIFRSGVQWCRLINFLSSFLHVCMNEQANGKAQTQTGKKVDRNLPCFSLFIFSSFENILFANEWLLGY